MIPVVADVSKFDRTIDWAAAFAGRPELTGAIVRALFGFEGDAFFDLNVRRLSDLGRSYSPYFTMVPHYDIDLQIEYLQASLGADNWKCEGYLIPPSPELPNGVLNRLWVDCEVNSELSQSSAAARVKVLLDKAEAYLADNHTTPNTLPGQAKPGVYTNQSWWGAYVGYRTWAKDHKLWVANPGAVVPAMPVGWSEYELFQYTWTGDLAGFVRRPKVDLSKPFVRIPGTYRAKVTASTLNVRSGPSTSFPVVGSLTYGALVTVYEERTGWAKISATEEKWCSKMYLVVVP